MRASEFIVEAFDKPYAFNWSRGDHGDYDIFIKLPDGSPLNIAFNHEGDDGWHVAFDRGHSQEVTGEGDAQRIFATVLYAIQQFIGKEHPDKVYFSASKQVESGQNSESRSNLYSRMVKRYASSLGYDAVIDDFGRDSVMYILNKKQDVAEGTADDINKMFNNMYDPMTTNLQRVALMAMQGRQDEAGMQLNRVIKDASPEAQKKIIDAVNNIKPVTINGKVADSSTLDKSHKHQDWILNTFIPWIKKTIGHQDVTEEQSSPTMGINVRSDGNIDYASLIVDGKKKYESRQTDSLRPYVGKTVAIVRTGKGPAVAIGQVTVGEPIVVDSSKFDKMRKQHLVPQGSKFDIGADATKYLYPMIDPVRWDDERLVKQKGIIARKID